MGTSCINFQQYSRSILAKSLNDYHFFLNYNFLRIQFSLLTSNSRYAILLILLGDFINCHPYRKEEVMSDMESSLKLSAVASLLK